MKTVNREIFSAISGVLHNLYFSVPTPTALALWRQGDLLASWPKLAAPAAHQAACQEMERSLQQDDDAVIERDHYRLFIGPGEMLAYPWGSVYRDRENLLFSSSAQAVQHFVERWQLTLTLAHHQPLDHIGLLLGMLSQLLANEQWQAVDELLQQHLMPWAPRFLECTQTHAQTGFYRGVAQLTSQFLQAIMAERQLAITPCPLYK
ncbi:MAG: molecular chaperone TorD family protein [Ferrimonas sp.]